MSRTIHVNPPVAEGGAATQTTRNLLVAGTVAGPLFIVVSLVQAFTRDGFDIVGHPASLLSLGDFGWIQIANFVAAGLLFVAAAVGMRRAMGSRPGRFWAPVLTGIFGAALVAGGVFVADPALGFPPGAPEGIPEQISWHARVHGFAPMIGFTALNVAIFVFARYFAAIRQRGWMTASLAAGLAVLVLTVVFNMSASAAPGPADINFLPLWADATLGFLFASAVAARLRANIR